MTIKFFVAMEVQNLCHKMFDNKIFKQESFQSPNYNNCKLWPPAKAHMFYLDIYRLFIKKN